MHVMKNVFKNIEFFGCAFQKLTFCPANLKHRRSNTAPAHRNLASTDQARAEHNEQVTGRIWNFLTVIPLVFAATVLITH